jgi:hypothetical protein
MKVFFKRFIIVLLLISFSLTMTGCGILKKISNILHFGEASNFEYGVTALQWLSTVQERALQWSPDAYFYGITETPVNKDGASDKWNYLFYSPGTEKVGTVTYEAGFVSFKETVLPPLNQIRNLRLDSPAALNLANQNGGTEFIANNQNVSVIMSLYGPRSGAGSSTWYIKYYGDVKSLTFLVDAATGKLIK